MSACSRKLPSLNLYLIAASTLRTSIFFSRCSARAGATSKLTLEGYAVSAEREVRVRFVSNQGNHYLYVSYTWRYEPRLERVLSECFGLAISFHGILSRGRQIKSQVNHQPKGRPRATLPEGLYLSSNAF